jgi:AP-4 complex subunit sigma-1
MLRFLLIVNKQGQLRLSHYFFYTPIEERKLLEAEVTRKCLSRGENLCTFVDHRDMRLVYRYYASLCVIIGADQTENEMSVYEFIHLIMETLDQYFNKVTETHIVFNIDKVHLILQEMVSNGRIAETNKNRILAPVLALDKVSAK